MAPQDDFFSQFNELSSPAALSAPEPDQGYFGQFKELKPPKPFLEKIGFSAPGESINDTFKRLSLQDIGAVGQILQGPLALLNLTSTVGLDQYNEMRSEDPSLPELNKEDLRQMAELQRKLPTYENLERYAEEKTGLPLQAKSPAQEAYRLAKSLLPAGIQGANKLFGRKFNFNPPVAAPAREQLAQLPHKVIGEVLPPGAEPPPGGPITPIFRGGAEEINAGRTAAHAGELAQLQAQHAQQLQAAEQAATPIAPQVAQQAMFRGGAASPAQRAITVGGESFPLKPTAVSGTPSLTQRVRHEITPVEVPNTTEGGRVLQAVMNQTDRQVYGAASELYNELDREIAHVEGFDQQMVTELQNYRNTMESQQIVPGSIEARIIDQADAILDVMNPEGSGFRAVPVSQIMGQARSIRRNVKNDYTHGEITRMFLPLVEILNNGVTRILQQQAPAAAQLSQRANQAWGQWRNTFRRNPTVSKYFNTKTGNPSELYTGAKTSIDEFNQIRPILNMTPEGQTLARSLQADIVEKHLAKYLKDPTAARGREWDLAVRELEPVIGEDEAARIRQMIESQPRPPKIKKPEAPKAEKVPPPKLPAPPKRVTSEMLMQKMRTPTGIEEVKAQVSPATFDRFRRAETLDLMKGRQVDMDVKKLKGDEIYNRLSNRDNYEALVEMWGQAEIDEARAVARTQGKKALTSDAINDAGKKIIKHASAYKLLALFF